MRTVVIALILIQGIVSAQTPCDRHGDAKKGTLAYALNYKKNRVDVPASYTPISILDFLKLPDDSYGDGEAYELTGGYVIEVKKQGAESCNCKSKTDRDFHIVVVPSPEDLGDISRYVIVEITPRVQKLFNWKDEDIRNLKDHYVDFSGWKFADLEHRNMSVKSNPTRTSCWRGTINEIHPVIKFVINNNPN
jgi:hypothetical protein